MNNLTETPEVLEEQDYLKPCACGICDQLVDTRKKRNGQFQKYVLGHHRKSILPPKAIKCACGCGEHCLDRDAYNNPRKYVPGHGWRRLKDEDKRNQRFMLHFTSGELKALKEAAGDKRLSAWIRELALERIPQCEQ